MGDFFRRIRLPLIFAALVLLTTFFMIGDQRAARGERVDAPWPLSAILEAAAPIQRAVRWPFERIGGGWDEYVALIEVGRENSTLRGRIATLEEENLQLREALVESGNLARLSALRADFESPLLPVRVIGQDVSPYFRSLLLDRGRGSGVLSGMPVVSDRGLVGLVTATTPSAARAGKRATRSARRSTPSRRRLMTPRCPWCRRGGYGQRWIKCSASCETVFRQSRERSRVCRFFESARCARCASTCCASNSTRLATRSVTLRVRAAESTA